METEQPRLTHIEGWGADLEHANRPAYPKERMPARLTGIHWSQPQRQPQTVKVFHSNERPNMTPVFGTTVPPKGLSGGLRSIAFKFTENDLRHWLLLLFADRVNMVEGIFEDLGRGHIPNLYEEMGLKSEFKYNRPAAIRKVVIAGAAVGLGIYLLRRRKSRP
jgi:hypothetical protein